MKWYWKVRLCRQDGVYGTCFITTEENGLATILVIKQFYESFTFGKMIIEGMSETPNVETFPFEVFTFLFMDRK